VRRSKIDVPLG